MSASTLYCQTFSRDTDVLTSIKLPQLDELLARINRRINEAEGLTRERRSSLGKLQGSVMPR
jgi:hypothetical protein